MSMSMENSTSSSDVEMTMMTPWLHFIGGDNLFFKTLHPSSRGAIAGACIVLGLLAIFERWLSGTRGVLEARWMQSAQAIFAGHTAGDEPAAVVVTPGEEVKGMDVDVNSLQEGVGRRTNFRSLRVSRVSPPFILSADVPRGVVFMCQAFLAYTLMLAVMTFQAAYIISIVVGLGIGEVLFGRFGSARGHVLH